jgi:hypothetical protein
MPQPQLTIVEGGKAKKLGGKTEQALNELRSILKLASADGKIDDEELRAVMRWRSQYRTVLRRMPIQPFDDWLEEAMADGNISDDERRELMQWADRLGSPTPLPSPKMEASSRSTVSQQQTGDQYLAIPKSRRPSWKNDPATAKQIAFLLDLGESERACRGLTKGEASSRIDALLQTEREERHGSYDGGGHSYGHSESSCAFHVLMWGILGGLVLIALVALSLKR